MHIRYCLLPTLLIAVSFLGGLGSHLAIPAAVAAPGGEPGEYGTLPAPASVSPSALNGAPAAPASRGAAVPFVNKLRQPDAPAQGRGAPLGAGPSVASQVDADIAATAVAHRRHPRRQHRRASLGSGRR